MRLRLFVWTIALALVVPALSRAQTPAGAIAGRVEDASHAGMAGVTLELGEIETGVLHTTVSRDDGQYEFRGLPQGRYRIRAASPGFAASENREVTLGGGQVVSLTLTLQIEELRQTITVDASAAPLDLSSTHSSLLVTDDVMAAMPVSGRSLEQIALLAPGMKTVRAKDTRSLNGFTKTITSSGARGATFLVDGLNVQHAIFADDTPGGVSGLLLGMESVKEIEVMPDAYPAYVGGTGGPVVSVLTRRGTREFHGSLFDYSRDERLDARNFFDREKPALSRHQFGGALGGPLPGPKWTFFASYERLRERLGRTFISTVPDVGARQGILPDGRVQVSSAVQPILDRYPLPNGESFGDGSAAFVFQGTQPTDDHHLNLRTDVELSSRDVLFGRYTMQDSAKIAPVEQSIDGFDNDLRARNHYAAIESRHVFSSRMINTVQVGLNRSGYSSYSFTTLDLANLAPLIPGRQNFGRLNIRGLDSFGTDTADLSFRMTQLSVTDTLLVSRGRHDWTMGFDWKRYRSDGTYEFFFNGLLIYENLRAFLLNQPQRFTGASPGSDARKRYRQDLFAFYVQDQFRWSPDFTVSYGLRYDPFTVPTEADGKIANLRNLMDSAPTVGDPLFENPSWTNLAPRVGLAWRPGGSERLVVRSGFGLFFDPIRENLFGYGARVQQPFVTVRTINAPPYPNPTGAARQGQPRQDPFEFTPSTPYMMRYHLTVQRALAGNLVARVGYVGSRGVHLPRVGDINTPDPTRIDPDGAVFFGTTTAVRKNPLFERVRYTSTDANSVYNEVQAGLNHRMSRGLQFDVNYSFSRSIDDASGYRRSYTNSVADVPPYYFDRSMDRGLSNFHVAHQAVLSYTWQIPGAPGRAGLAGALSRNWQTSGVLTMSSGYPFSLNVAYDVANNTVREGHRPNLAAGASNNPVLGGPDRYFDVSAFALQPPGYLGNLGRNTLIGPGYVSLDVSLQRRLALSSRHAVEIRLDAFNVLNRANFAAPQNSGTGGVILFNDATGVPVGNAAKIFSTAGPSRQMQVAARWTF